MHHVVYRAIRFAPKGAGGSLAFLASIWAAVDAQGFQRHLRQIDVSHTGSLVAMVIVLWLALLWLTRNWNIPDRERYVAGLQRYLIEHSNAYQRIKSVKTDEALDKEEPKWNSILQRTAAWIFLNMGEAAAAKYVSGTPGGLSYPWEGEHSGPHREKRNNLLVNVDFRMTHLNELLGSGHWDDPVALRKRRRSEKWQLQIEQIRGELGDEAVREL